MKSPFPGMDPFLEPHWLDLHSRLIVASARQIQRQLSNDLLARIEARVLVQDASGSARLIGPDVHIIETRPAPQPPASTSSSVAVAEPTVLTTHSEPITQRYIEIIDVSSGGRVITVLEFLSPSNKLPGIGRRLYRQKQDDCLDAGVNLVEVDLTRAGERSLLCNRWDSAERYTSTYQISAWCAAKPSQVELYQIALSQPLPSIRIPLRPSDSPAILELQRVLDECYLDARYERLINYTKPLTPPLSDVDAKWLQNLLAAG